MDHLSCVKTVFIVMFGRDGEGGGRPGWIRPLYN